MVPSVPPLSVVIVTDALRVTSPLISTPGVSFASEVVISPPKVIPPPAVAVKVLISAALRQVYLHLQLLQE